MAIYGSTRKLNSFLFSCPKGGDTINKKQIEVEKAKLAEEQKVFDALKKYYGQAASDAAKKIKLHNGKISVLLNDWDNLDEQQKSILQSKIYQRDFQLSLKKQLDEILDNLNTKQYKTVEEYLKDSYEMGFLGTMYDIHGQGIPLVLPIDQKAAVKAAKLDSKISKKLYGSYVTELKKRIQAEVSRGVASNISFKDIARNLNMQAGIGLNKAMRIARTEGHGVQIQAANDAQHKAKAAGADVVKQWDAALDGKTRDSHRQVDGQIRELDEKFSNGMMYPSDPAGGASEVVNCRCALLQRAKWALDEEELETLQERAAFFGLDKTDSFEDFKKKYKIAASSTEKAFDITEGGKYIKLNIADRNKYADYIENDFTTQKMTVKELRTMWDKTLGYIQNSEGYQDINGFLRGLKTKLTNPRRRLTIGIMERLTNNNSLKKDYIGTRKVDSEYLKNVLGLEVADQFKMSMETNAFGTKRPVRIPKNKAAAQIVADQINKLVGTDKAIISDKAFTSVSMSEKLNYFTHYPIKFEIQMPAGTKGVLTDNLMESEFIAKKGSAIEILGTEVYNDGGKYCVKILSRMIQQ